MTTYTFTPEELDATLDALMKGASRHDSYARFYPGRNATRKHETLAATMRQLHKKLLVYRAAA